MSDLQVVEATPDDAAVIRDVIHAAFAPRPHLDPPSTALAETAESVAAALDEHGGLLCRVDGLPAGAVLFDRETVGATTTLALRRVSAIPHFQARGVASAIVGVAEEVAAARGYDDVTLRARTELPATLVFWERRGYREVWHEGPQVLFGKALPVELVAGSADEARAVGRCLAALCAAGDVVILTGELGAGKTTLTQGLGAGLGVRGDVTSPTFVISRVHPSLGDGPPLIHVDAYRLGDEAELDDLDLDAYVDAGVTVVEWGEGIAEALSDARLRVHVSRARGTRVADGPDDTDDPRTVTVTPLGARWIGAGVRSSMLGCPAFT
ncbi:MAG: tRNA (adenosine(37)-N6)-threonylcarbamoyltransferase complex ATPase subunit type 1 TsaE [Nocardioidaceae bacterium]